MKSAIRHRPPYDDDEFAIPIVKLYRFHLGDADPLRRHQTARSSTCGVSSDLRGEL